MNPAISNSLAILKLQTALAEHPDNLVDIPDATHVFAPGAYARTIILPKGSAVVGKMHRHAHVNVISYGSVRVSTYEGFKDYSGHNLFVSLPNVKRAVHALEETCWTTIHITNEADLAKIEEDVIIAEDSEEFLSTFREMIGGAE
jgi:hypothetical protein